MKIFGRLEIGDCYWSMLFNMDESASIVKTVRSHLVQVAFPFEFATKLSHLQLLIMLNH